MRKALILALAAGALIAGTAIQARPGERLRERLAARQTPSEQVPQPAGKQTLSYGNDRLQVLDFYPARNGDRRAPLVLFVHGGGWKRGSKDNADGSWKAPHYTQTYAYASINYRLVPASTVEDEASDVAAALRYLIDNAARLGFDPSRVVIMGHSAGAHLVALVGTDEQYLRKAGLSFASIDGVLPIDGAAYDVPRQIADGSSFMNETYIQAFGTDAARQRALSPTLQAPAPNAPDFLLIHVMRKDGVAQNKQLEAALRQGGTRVERREFPGTGLKGHGEINRQLGNPDYAATPVVDAWLKRVFGN
ncbi:MAG: alpha/beta hydrolase [Sphingomonadaceae bacterium]